jgi:hypothetical protein
MMVDGDPMMLRTLGENLSPSVGGAAEEAA